MNVFQTAKTVSPADVARVLGLQESRGKFCCPFHDDHHPSMVCYADSKRFYCFACTARGDATDLWAKVTGTTPRTAAEAVCKAFGLEATPEFEKQDAARRSGSGPRWDPGADALARERQRRTDRVSILPELVLEAWRDAMVSILGTQMDACEKLFEVYPDPNGWRWQTAFRRMSALHDEMNRLKAIPVTQLAAEAADRRADPHGGALLPGQLEFSDDLLRDILRELLSKDDLQLAPEERDYVYRTLQIGPKEQAGAEGKTITDEEN